MDDRAVRPPGGVASIRAFPTAGGRGNKIRGRPMARWSRSISADMRLVFTIIALSLKRRPDGGYAFQCDLQYFLDIPPDLPSRWWFRWIAAGRAGIPCVSPFHRIADRSADPRNAQISPGSLEILRNRHWSLRYKIPYGRQGGNPRVAERSMQKLPLVAKLSGPNPAGHNLYTRLLDVIWVVLRLVDH